MARSSKTSGGSRAKSRGRARRAAETEPERPRVRATVREPISNESLEGDLDNLDVGENWMETRPLLGINAGGQLDDTDLGAQREHRADIARGGRVSATAALGDDENPHGSYLGLDDEADVKERVKKEIPPRSERTGAQTRQKKSSPHASKKQRKASAMKAPKPAPPRSPQQKTKRGGG
jgi:hypothetical protein